ncbi:MAG: hypothetical protein GY819_14480 [Planctomycetaceae bacterium]|nr:hypothetical protein [Planctomycetaceae bacterium]MCP4463995.1 hypothetical protein [Planctomycetaceae bacterium]
MDCNFDFHHIAITECESAREAEDESDKSKSMTRAKGSNDLPKEEGANDLHSFAWSPDFPPEDICEDDAKVREWFVNVFEQDGALVRSQKSLLTEREKLLLRLSASEYMEMRKAGEVSCYEYASSLLKRAAHLRRMNQFLSNSYELLHPESKTAEEIFMYPQVKFLAQATALDFKAAQHGIEAIAPLYGLPIPVKGTAAVVDYPTGCGCGILMQYEVRKDCGMVRWTKQKNGIVFGSTNVSEFATSYMTGSPAHGIARNPYSMDVDSDSNATGAHTCGGSSGGAASAVASYVCPVAWAEDTGGSNRVPSGLTQNFGYDPTKGKYPNDGNIAMTYTNDQVGLMARSIDDLIAMDRAFFGSPRLSSSKSEEKDGLESFEKVRERLHKKYLDKSFEESPKIRIGFPRVPFVETVCASEESANNLFIDDSHKNMTLSCEMMRKWNLCKRAFRESDKKSLFDVVEEEWPTKKFDYDTNLSQGETLQTDSAGKNNEKGSSFNENVLMEALFSGRKVNGKNYSLLACHGKVPPVFMPFGGLVQSWVSQYLKIPRTNERCTVSLAEIDKSAKKCGNKMHAYPFFLGSSLDPDAYDETQLRYIMGAKIKENVESWNSYFDAHDVDLIVLPLFRNEAPSYRDLADGSVEFRCVQTSQSGEGQSRRGGMMENNFLHCGPGLKTIYFPKLAFPTGLSKDGRSTGFQLCGRALAYEQMFDDLNAEKSDREFLELCKIVLDHGLHSFKDGDCSDLLRVDAPMCRRDLFDI